MSGSITEDEFSNDESNPIRSSNSLRFDNELYKQEDDVNYTSVSIKRVKLPKGGEDWEIYENKKRTLILKGARFTKNERDFLRTIDGINFLLEGYKNGNKFVSQFKKDIVKFIKA